MISNRKTIDNLKKITGTIDKRGNDLTKTDSYIREAKLIKIDLNKFTSDGWLIQLKDNGKTYWAENKSSSYRESNSPLGPVEKNILVVRPIINALVYQDKIDEGWRIIVLDDPSIRISEAGVKILGFDNSYIKITPDYIDIVTPKLYRNGVEQ